jgi:hypothetical protein
VVSGSPDRNSCTLVTSPFGAKRRHKRNRLCLRDLRGSGGPLCTPSHQGDVLEEVRIRRLWAAVAWPWSRLPMKGVAAASAPWYASSCRRRRAAAYCRLRSACRHAGRPRVTTQMGSSESSVPPTAFSEGRDAGTAMASGVQSGPATRRPGLPAPGAAYTGALAGGASPLT